MHLGHKSVNSPLTFESPAGDSQQGVQGVKDVNLKASICLMVTTRD